MTCGCSGTTVALWRWFYELFRRGQGDDPDYASWNSPSWKNPILNRDLIEAERARLPERVFRQEYGGEFIEGVGQVFRNVRELATGEWQEPRYDETYYAGLDLARVEDYTVLTIVNDRGEVVFLDRFSRLDWSLQMVRIKAGTERYNDCEVYRDVTGVGDPIFEALKKEGTAAKVVWIPHEFARNRCIASEIPPPRES